MTDIMRRLAIGLAGLAFSLCADAAVAQTTPTFEQEAYDWGRAQIGKTLWGTIDLFFTSSPNGLGMKHERGPFQVLALVQGPTSGTYLFQVRLASGEVGFVEPVMKSLFVDEDPAVTKAKAKAECDRRGGIRPGMTAAQVLASCLGEPRAKNVTVTARTRSEQWVYPKAYVYLKNGVVEAWQTAP